MGPRSSVGSGGRRLSRALPGFAARRSRRRGFSHNIGAEVAKITTPLVDGRDRGKGGGRGRKPTRPAQKYQVPRLAGRAARSKTNGKLCVGSAGKENRSIRAKKRMITALQDKQHISFAT